MYTIDRQGLFGVIESFAIRYHIHLAFTLVLLSLNSAVIGQLQLNLGASGYAQALNKTELYSNPFQEYSSQYQTSKYLTLGVGYLVKEKHYIGLEASYQRTLLTGSSFNPFLTFSPDEWELTTSEYTSHNYSRRIGLRYTYYFLSGNNFRPFVGASMQYSNEFYWVKKGESTYVMLDPTENKIEPFQNEYQNDLSQLYWDSRIGTAFYFNDHSAISLALEFSSGLTSLRENSNPEDRINKYEIALPFTFHYQF